MEAILTKSEANRASHLSKLQKAMSLNPTQEPDPVRDNSDPVKYHDEDCDLSIIDSKGDVQYVTIPNSTVNINPPTGEPGNENGGEQDDPNIYDNIDVVAWDIPISPIQLAILMGHSGAVRALGDRGADILRPIIHKSPCFSEKDQAILPMRLALHHPMKTSMALIETLFGFGALLSQADRNNITVFHLIVSRGEPEFLDLLFRIDASAAQIAIDIPALVKVNDMTTKVQLPLSTAIKYRDLPMVSKLIEHGANMSVSSERLQRLCVRQKQDIEQPLEHPLIVAIRTSNSAVVKTLIDAGADPNLMTPGSYYLLKEDNFQPPYPRNGKTVLDVIHDTIMDLERRQSIVASKVYVLSPPSDREPDSTALVDLTEDTYEY